LSDTGRKAFMNAVHALSEFGDDPALLVEGIARYARACDDAQFLRDQWEAEGKPLHSTGSTDSLVVHPFVKGLRDAESHSAAMAKAIGLTPDGRKRPVGRPAGASQAADRRPQIRKAA
jgi:hypothetical protein